MSHDFAAQRAETFETFAEIGKDESLPKRAVVYFQFFAEEFDCDWAGVEAALRALGFAAEHDEDEGMLTASIGPIDVTPEAIWREEERATRAVLPFDFFPDGWDMATDD